MFISHIYNYTGDFLGAERLQQQFQHNTQYTKILEIETKAKLGLL